MPSRRHATTLAVAVLAALGACSKEVGSDASRSSVGARIDHALDRTRQELSTAGEKAKQEVEQASEKTQEALSKAGGKISAATGAAVSEAKQSLQSATPPYAPRQPVDGSAAGAADSSAAQPATTTTTLSTGPSTTIKITPADSAAR